MFRLFSGMVLTLWVGLALCAAEPAAQARCPQKDDVWHSDATRKAGIAITFVATFYNFSTVYPSHSSGTSGCGKSGSASREEEARDFVAGSGTGLLQEMAQGGGQRVTSLAAVLGCEPAAQSAFARLVQTRFADIVPSDVSPPEAMVAKLMERLRADPVTARGCSVL